MNRGNAESPRNGMGKFQLVSEGGCEGIGARTTVLGDRSSTDLTNSEALCFVPQRLSGEDCWLIWQLVDSAFPTGGFAHSAGLEAAWQHGEVRNRQELDSFISSSLQQLGRAAVPFVAAAFNEPDRLVEFDELCDSFTNNHVANRASRAQGRAFLSAWKRIFKRGDPETAREPAPLFGHFAPVFGMCLRRLQASRTTTCRIFFFNHLRGLYAAAVRLNIVGPMEAQAAQFEMAAMAEPLLPRCELLTLDDIAQTSPLLDIWQGAHDRLYSRLFQS